jgi:LysR family nitrogen assimilation transcriptional regulator
VNLKQLEYFVRVAELGSFSRAAPVLDVAQPVLSRQLRLLETELGCALLRRTGRGVVLTEAGKLLVERATGILQLVQQARADLEERREEPTGRVVIGLPPSLGRMLTLSLVAGFRSSLANARLVIVEGLSSYLLEWIATGRVDLALVHNPEPQTSIDIQPILEEPLCLVGPTRYRSRRGSRAAARAEVPVPFADLPQYSLVMTDRSQAIRRQVEAQAVLSGVALRIEWEVSGVPAILDMVRAGYGYAVLSRGAVFASGVPLAFSVRPIEQPALLSKLCLASPARKPTTPLVRHATRMLRDLAQAAVNQPQTLISLR